MGFFDKLAGRPTSSRRTSSKREERHNERASMRASRDSSSWGPSPQGSTTAAYSGYHAGPPQSSSRRLSSPPSRRSSHTGQQPSPLASPRQQHNEGPSIVDKMKHAVFGGTGANAPPSQSAKYPSDAQPNHVPARQPHTDIGRTSQVPQQQNTEQVRDLQNKVHAMEAEVQEVEKLKQWLLAEQRSAHEWREKWNYQNFKLNLMVDMLVLHTLEAEGGTIPAIRTNQPTSNGTRTSSASPTLITNLNKGVVAGVGGGGGAGALAGVGRQAASRRDTDMVEEDYED